MYFFAVENINKENSDNWLVVGGIFLSEIMFKMINYGSIGLSTWLNRISKKEVGATFVSIYVVAG